MGVGTIGSGDRAGNGCAWMSADMGIEGLPIGGEAIRKSCMDDGVIGSLSRVVTGVGVAAKYRMRLGC